MRSRCRATTARSACWSTARWRACIARGRINAILAKTFGRAPPDEMLKAMILINSLPDH